jgi:predicted component of type VI protein secretion system
MVSLDKDIEFLTQGGVFTDDQIDAYIALKFEEMNTFEFKNLVKTLKNSLKQRTFFKDLRKEVETGANGTQDYVVKKGVNKDTIATTRQ